MQVEQQIKQTSKPERQIQLTTQLAAAIPSGLVCSRRGRRLSTDDRFFRATTSPFRQDRILWLPTHRRGDGRLRDPTRYRESKLVPILSSTWSEAHLNDK